jgi:hypothetical protein
MAVILRKNRFGQVFTITTILLFILFFVVLEVSTTLYHREAVARRVSTMETYLYSLEQDLQRKLYIFSYRTLFSLEDVVSRTGTYVPNVSSVFDEAFFNGTIYGNVSTILNDTTYAAILLDVNKKSQKINVNVSISQPSITVSQKDSWTVQVTLFINLTMFDNTQLASWSRQENISTLINIEGFDDPLYIINTNGRVPYKINRSIYVLNGTLTNLTAHFNGKSYLAHSDAPSFLKRLEGSLAADPQGIESLVDLSAFSAQGLEVKQKSIVDHVYFSTSNPSATQIPGKPSWFKIDSNNYAAYNVSN